MSENPFTMAESQVINHGELRTIAHYQASKAESVRSVSRMAHVVKK